MSEGQVYINIENRPISNSIPLHILSNEIEYAYLIHAKRAYFYFDLILGEGISDSDKKKCFYLRLNKNLEISFFFSVKTSSVKYIAELTPISVVGLQNFRIELSLDEQEFKSFCDLPANTVLKFVKIELEL